MAQKIRIDFTCEFHWEGNNLIIECPTAAAQAFIARAIEEQLVIRVKPEGKGDRECLK